MFQRAFTRVVTFPLLTLNACGSSCPHGRVETPEGTCVRQDVVDFATCVRSAGGSEISRADARTIAASAFGVSGTVGWRNDVRARYAGPGAEHQRLVIDHCMARTVSSEPAPDLSFFSGRWSSVQADTSGKYLTVNPDGRFTMHREAPRCRVEGIIDVRVWTLTRHITWSDCAGAPVGETQRFKFDLLGTEAFTLAPEPGGGPAETFRRAQ